MLKEREKGIAKEVLSKCLLLLGHNLTALTGKTCFEKALECHVIPYW